MKRRRHLRRWIFGQVLVIFALAPCVCLWAEEIILTLDEAEALVIRDNRDILLKAEDVRKAKEKIKEAKAGLLPSLDFSGSWTDTKGYYAKPLAQTAAQAGLKQYLYKGGKTLNTVKQNKYESEVSEAVLDRTKLEILLSVKKAFFTLLLAEEFSRLNKGILDNARSHLGSLRLRYESGEVSRSDVLKVESSLADVEQVYEGSLNQAESAKALLRNLLYLGEDARIKPDGALFVAPKEFAYEDAFLKAIERRPEIRQYKAQENSDKKALDIAKAESRPNIYASWDYYSRSHLSASGGKNWNDYNVMGFTFTWPIFDGWMTKHKVEEALIDLKETRLAAEKTFKDIAWELKSAYLELKNSAAKIKTVAHQIDLYKDTLRVTEEKYKEGMASLLELDDAKLGYQVSLFNQKQAFYDYLIAKAKFEKATGG